MKSYATQGHLNDHLKKHREGKIDLTLDQEESMPFSYQSIRDTNSVRTGTGRGAGLPNLKIDVTAANNDKPLKAQSHDDGEERLSHFSPDNDNMAQRIYSCQSQKE